MKHIYFAGGCFWVLFFKIEILPFLIIGLTNVICLGRNMIKEALIILSKVFYEKRKQHAFIDISIFTAISALLAAAFLLGTAEKVVYILSLLAFNNNFS